MLRRKHMGAQDFELDDVAHPRYPAADVGAQGNPVEVHAHVEPVRPVQGGGDQGLTCPQT